MMAFRSLRAPRAAGRAAGCFFQSQSARGRPPRGRSGRGCRRRGNGPRIRDGWVRGCLTRMMNGDAAHRAVSREPDERRCIRIAMTMSGEQIRSRRRAHRTGRPLPRLRDGCGPGALQTNTVRHQQTAFEQIAARWHPHATASRCVRGIQRLLKSRRVIRLAIAHRAETADIEWIGAYRGTFGCVRGRSQRCAKHGESGGGEGLAACGG